MSYGEKFAHPRLSEEPEIPTESPESVADSKPRDTAEIILFPRQTEQETDNTSEVVEPDGSPEEAGLTVEQQVEMYGISSLTADQVEEFAARKGTLKLAEALQSNAITDPEVRNVAARAVRDSFDDPAAKAYFSQETIAFIEALAAGEPVVEVEAGDGPESAEESRNKRRKAALDTFRNFAQSHGTREGLKKVVRSLIAEGITDVAKSPGKPDDAINLPAFLEALEGDLLPNSVGQSDIDAALQAIRDMEQYGQFTSVPEAVSADTPESRPNVEESRVPNNDRVVESVDTRLVDDIEAPSSLPEAVAKLLAEDLEGSVAEAKSHRGWGMDPETYVYKQFLANKDGILGDATLHARAIELVLELSKDTNSSPQGKIALNQLQELLGMTSPQTLVEEGAQAEIDSSMIRATDQFTEDENPTQPEQPASAQVATEGVPSREIALQQIGELLTQVPADLLQNSEKYTQDIIDANPDLFTQGDNETLLQLVRAEYGRQVGSSSTSEDLVDSPSAELFESAKPPRISLDEAYEVFNRADMRSELLSLRKTGDVRTDYKNLQDILARHGVVVESSSGKIVNSIPIHADDVFGGASRWNLFRSSVSGPEAVNGGFNLTPKELGDLFAGDLNIEEFIQNHLLDAGVEDAVRRLFIND